MFSNSRYVLPLNYHKSERQVMRWRYQAKVAWRASNSRHAGRCASAPPAHSRAGFRTPQPRNIRAASKANRKSESVATHLSSQSHRTSDLVCDSHTRLQQHLVHSRSTKKCTPVNSSGGSTCHRRHIMSSPCIPNNTLSLTHT